MRLFGRGDMALSGAGRPWCWLEGCWHRDDRLVASAVSERPLGGDEMMLQQNPPDTGTSGWLASVQGTGSSHLRPRRESTGFGGLTRPPLLVGVAMAALLVVAACTSTGPGDSTSSSSIPATTSTSTNLSSTSTSTSTSMSVTSTPSLTEDVIDAWSAYWDAWVEVRGSDDLDPGPLEAVADPDVVDGALTLFERQRSSGLGPVQTDVVLHATVIDSEADRATVEDCVLLVPAFTDATGVWYQADLSLTERGWVVEAIWIPSGDGCVPREMADAAIGGYEAYYRAREDFWDPPDPDHPLISEVLAEPQKSFIVGLLDEHEARGVALRGQPTTHPEVIEVRSATELVILSCLEPDPDYGLYDLQTGVRLPDEQPVRAGQRDLESGVIVLEDDLWKVSDLQGQVDFECEFAPTDRGLPSV